MTAPRTDARGSFLFKPANASQAAACRAFAASDILILCGGAGTGKTHVAVGLAMQEVLAKRAEKIILTRPTVPLPGEDMGFLPGKVEAKMHPWLLPIHDVLSRQTFQSPNEWLKEHCEVAPLAYMRGRTFGDCVAILDEAQNCTLPQLRLFLSRIGRKGKLILAGDPLQSDRPGFGDGQSGFASMIERLSPLAHTVPGVVVASLDGCQNPRHPIIPALMEALR